MQLSTAAGAVPRFSGLTTRPNVLVAPVHDRMPVVLDDKRFDEWLTSEPAVALQMLTPAPRDALVATKVSNHVNKVKQDDPAWALHLGARRSKAPKFRGDLLLPGCGESRCAHAVSSSGVSQVAWMLAG